VERTFEQNRRQYGTNANYLVRPGLLADRARKQVRLNAESAKLNAADPVEFPLIAQNSGKDYEALAVAFAKPSDVHDALVFIGLTPGCPVDPGAFRFWPKGERVRMTFVYRDATNTLRTATVEHFILDSRTGKTLPDEGFAFTGSTRVPAPGTEGTATVYAADVYSPNAIAVVYNDSTAVLDVPRRVSQNEVYSYQVPNPALPLLPHQLLEVVIEPKDANAPNRVHEYVLQVRPSPSTPGDAALELTDSSGTVISTNRTARGLASALDRLVAEGQDPYVTVVPGDALPLSALGGVCGSLDSLENGGKMRVEPPPKGHPYYKAFLPNEKFRSRKERTIQPMELRLGEGTASPTGTLTFIEEKWNPETDVSVYTETNCPVASPKELADLLGRKNAPSVLLVFASADLTYGALRTSIEPALDRRLILYVFLPPPQKP